MAEAIRLESCPENIEIIKKVIVGAGEIKISRREANEYEAEFWEGFAYWLGKRIIDAYKEKLTKECTISFFPKGTNNIENLVRRQNTTFLNKDMIAPLFYINYDKNLQIVGCNKHEKNIPTKMGFIIFN